MLRFGRRLRVVFAMDPMTVETVRPLSSAFEIGEVGTDEIRPADIGTDTPRP